MSRICNKTKLKLIILKRSIKLIQFQRNYYKSAHKSYISTWIIAPVRKNRIFTSLGLIRAACNRWFKCRVYSVTLARTMHSSICASKSLSCFKATTTIKCHTLCKYYTQPPQQCLPNRSTSRKPATTFSRRCARSSVTVA